MAAPIPSDTIPMPIDKMFPILMPYHTYIPLYGEVDMTNWPDLSRYLEFKNQLSQWDEEFENIK